MDKNLQFSSAQAVTATADSTNTYDELIGNMITTSGGAYTASSASIIGVNTTLFGEDLGIGNTLGHPVVVISSGSGSPGGASSLTISILGAPDIAGAGNLSSLVYVTYIQTRAIPVGSILASSRLATIPWPIREVKQPFPRFIKLAYTVGGSPFTNLTINADVTLGPSSADSIPLFPSNF